MAKRATDDDGSNLPPLEFTTTDFTDDPITLANHLIEVMRRLGVDRGERTVEGGRRYVMFERDMEQADADRMSLRHILRELRAIERGRLQRSVPDPRFSKPQDPVLAEAVTGDLEPTLVEKALGMMAADHHLAVTKIAKTLGCSRSKLYRDYRFKQARELMREVKKRDAADRRGRIPRGVKDKGGNIEAWSD